jgi:hypothetical protein
MHLGAYSIERISQIFCSPKWTVTFLAFVSVIPSLDTLVSNILQYTHIIEIQYGFVWWFYPSEIWEDTQLLVFVEFVYLE